eukprot:689995-Prymnesium_polylepis.1
MAAASGGSWCGVSPCYLAQAERHESRENDSHCGCEGQRRAVCRLASEAGLGRVCTGIVHPTQRTEVSVCRGSDTLFTLDPRPLASHDHGH